MKINKSSAHVKYQKHKKDLRAKERFTKALDNLMADHPRFKKAIADVKKKIQKEYRKNKKALLAALKDMKK